MKNILTFKFIVEFQSLNTYKKILSIPLFFLLKTNNQIILKDNQYILLLTPAHDDEYTKSIYFLNRSLNAEGIKEHFKKATSR